MIFLPIVERELRVAARQRGTYWIRLGAVVAGLAVGAWIMLIPFIRNTRDLGIALFSSLAVVTFVYSLMIGIRTTADCLSEEKREGTLGLLFLTDLKGYDIVFGKLAATSVNAFYGMVAVFPILAISLLAGGVTGSEFARVVLACINNVFFSLAVGMFSSAISRDERKAMAAAFGLTLLFTAGLPAIGEAIHEARNLAQPHPFFFIPSPGYSCFMAFEKVARATGAANTFYVSIATIHGLAWLFLILACWIVPRTWHDKVEDATTNPLRRKWRDLVFGTPEQRRALRRSLLEINPIYWLTSRDRLKTYLVWIFLLALGILWAWGLWKYPRTWKDDSAYIMTALFAHAALKIWLTTEAIRQFGFDRRSGALELLLSTPLSVPQIVRGQLLSLWRQFAAAATVVVVADFVFMSASNGDASWNLYWVATIVVFILDLITLAWVSMWLGLCHKSSSRAAGGALARILVLPWVVFLLLGMFVSFQSVSRPNWMDDEDGVIATGLVIAIVNSFAFMMWARNRLLGDMRRVAVQRFEVRRGQFSSNLPVPPAPAAKPAGSPA